MKSYLKKNKIQILIITLVFLVIWHKILYQIPIGEGYYYFDRIQIIKLQELLPDKALATYDMFPRILFTFLQPLFRDNILLYIILQFTFMFFVYQILYFTLLKITKDKLLSLGSTILFISNYIGSFSILGTGGYQRFIQRFPNLILILPAFYFLDRYLKSERRKDFVKSYFLFALSLVLAHHVVFWSWIFIIFPPINSFLRKERLSKLIKSLKISSLFLATTYILTVFDTLSKPDKHTILQFIKNTESLPQKIFYQLPIVFFPPKLLQYFLDHSKSLLFPTLLIVLVLILISIKLYRNEKKLLAIFITLTSSLLLVCFLTLYAYGGVPNPLQGVGEDRIYFVQILFTSIITGIFIKAFFGKNKILYSIVWVCLLVFTLNNNTQLIWKGMERIQYKVELERIYINYIKGKKNEFGGKPILIISQPLAETSNFIKRFYMPPETTYITFHENWQNDLTKIYFQNKDVHVIDFSYELKEGVVDAKTIQLKDLTEDFKNGNKINTFKY